MRTWVDERVTTVQRHKAAIKRNTLSKPLRLAREYGLLPDGCTVFDYGCGRGDDVLRLQALGHHAVGWDPHHAPKTPKVSSEVVNLGFVLNVIERPQERLGVLEEAWSLAQDVLVVGALVVADAKGSAIPFGDGVLTSIRTFQKYYDQQELQNVIQQTTGIPPVALGVGVFAVVRDASHRARLLTAQYRVGRTMDKAAMEALFRENAAALAPLLDFFSNHGRWPVKEDELILDERVGSLGRARRLAQTGLQPETVMLVVERARADLLVVLGILYLSGCPKMNHLAPRIQRDLRAHFGTYRQAMGEAEQLLFTLGRADVLRAASRRSPVGKAMPKAHYVHVSALDSVSPELRLLEACARRFLGGREGANLVKLGVDSPVVSYLSYPTFEKDPHPALAWSLKVDLQTFRFRKRDFSKRENPPILHRKELFVNPSHPLRAKFARLTAQEERWDLFDGSTGGFGTRKGWERRLQAAGVTLKGHRVVVG